MWDSFFQGLRISHLHISSELHVYISSWRCQRLTGLSGDITQPVRSVLTPPGTTLPGIHLFTSARVAVAYLSFGVLVATIIMSVLVMTSLRRRAIVTVPIGSCLVRRIAGRVFISGRL